MTTLAQGANLIKQALLDADWPSPSPTIGLQNERTGREPEFVELEINYEGSSQDTQGAVRRYKRWGVVQVRILTPRNIGTSRADALGDAVMAAMEGTNAGGVVFRAAMPGYGGGWKNWYLLEIEAAFEYFHHK